MLTNILNLEGAKVLDKKVLTQVNGGGKHFHGIGADGGCSCGGNSQSNGAPLCVEC